jgi:hypothetical protein
MWCHMVFSRPILAEPRQPRHRARRRSAQLQEILVASFAACQTRLGPPNRGALPALAEWQPPGMVKTIHPPQSPVAYSPSKASRGFRGKNGFLHAARVPSIYSTVPLTPFPANYRAGAGSGFMSTGGSALMSVEALAPAIDPDHRGLSPATDGSFMLYTNLGPPSPLSQLSTLWHPLDCHHQVNNTINHAGTLHQTRQAHSFIVADRQ